MTGGESCSISDCSLWIEDGDDHHHQRHQDELPPIAVLPGCSAQLQLQLQLLPFLIGRPTAMIVHSNRIMSM